MTFFGKNVSVSTMLLLYPSPYLTLAGTGVAPPPETPAFAVIGGGLWRWRVTLCVCLWGETSLAKFSSLIGRVPCVPKTLTACCRTTLRMLLSSM